MELESAKHDASSVDRVEAGGPEPMMSDDMMDRSRAMPAVDSDAPTAGTQTAPTAKPRSWILPPRRAATPTGASFAKRARPRPSFLYPTLWRFAADRHGIYLRRLSGQPHPWTRDPVLASYRFTNVFRAADRVSQYLIRMAYSDHDAGDDTLFLRTLLFKIFNRIDTWESIVRAIGPPAADSFNDRACDALLTARRQAGRRIYSAAYIMPSGGDSGSPKHTMHLRLLRRMLDERLPAKLRRSRSLEDAYRLLLSYPTLGPFLAFQYAIDLNYTKLTCHSESSFVVAGPGALDGLSKCFESLGEYSAEDTILWLSDLQGDEFRRAGLSFDGLWGRSLRPIDVQNLLCEVSKYTRATHPGIKGRAGRGRIKQKFTAAGPMPQPFFPPKWELDVRVKKWVAENSRTPGECAQPLQKDLPLVMTASDTPGSG